MPEPTRETTLRVLEKLHAENHNGLRLLVTGGPTREPIDDVRFITNHSSGRMGIVIAEEAAALGWSTLLILGPTHLSPPAQAECVRVETAEQMHEAVLTAFSWCDAIVMSAAVADYTPAEPFTGKMKKQDGEMFLRLQRTQDILKSAAAHTSRPGKKVIGFALETKLNLDEGWRKLEEKKLDAIIVNTTEAFAAAESTACILRAGGASQDLGTISKVNLARLILKEIRD